MAWSSVMKPAAALLPQLQRTATPALPAAAAALLLCHRHGATTTSPPTPMFSTRTTPDNDQGRGVGRGSVIENPPPPGMAPLPEDAPRQTPPRLGEPDPAGPPVPPTSSEDKGAGGAAGEGKAPPGGMPDTAPPPDVAVPPVSPDGSNV